MAVGGDVGAKLESVAVPRAADELDGAPYRRARGGVLHHGAGDGETGAAVERAGEVTPLVLREESGVGAFSGSVLSLAREGVVYRALRDTGVRVPRLHAMTDDGQAMLLERAPGTGDLRRLPESERSAVL